MYTLPLPSVVLSFGLPLLSLSLSLLCGHVCSEIYFGGSTPSSSLRAEEHKYTNTHEYVTSVRLFTQGWKWNLLF